MDKRDELIKELRLRFRWIPKGCEHFIADFILARERKMSEQIEELKEKAWKYDQLSK